MWDHAGVSSRNHGPGLALVGDCGSFKDQITAMGITELTELSIGLEAIQRRAAFLATTDHSIGELLNDLPLATLAVGTSSCRDALCSALFPAFIARSYGNA
jgi:hypothetical protein